MFKFDPSERRAVIAIGTIVIIALVAFIWYDAKVGNERYEQEIAMRQRAEDLLVDDRSEKVQTHGTAGTRDKCKASVELRAFDPNEVDSATLVSFGLKPWKVHNMMRYRSAGAVFRSADDMLRTYGWEEQDINNLRPYVRVGAKYQKKEGTSRLGDNADALTRSSHEYATRDEATGETKRYHSNKFKTLTMVDINTADTALLKRIPGVGDKIAEAIVNHRNRLGGFVSVNQALDIKIVSPELLEWFVVEDVVATKHLDLNKGSFQSLNSHPYITYEQTKALLLYRRLYGDIKSVEQLRETQIFKEEELQRLLPYLLF